MNKLLFIILTVGFIVQYSGLASHLHKSVVKMEQCAGDTSQGEEDQHDELKNGDDKISLNFTPVTAFVTLIPAVGTFNDHFPAGFFSKFYLQLSVKIDNRV